MTELATNLTDATRAAEYYAQGYWRPEDLWTTIFNAASRNPDQLALVCGDRSVTYRELIQEATRLGAGLRERGIRRGDVVVIHARNSIESAQALLGCVYLGAVATPLPPMFSDRQLSSVVDKTQARAVIGLGDPSEVQRTIGGARAAASVQAVVVPDELAEGDEATVPWSALFGADDGEPRSAVDPDALAMLFFTSGTTGLPKGVMHSSNTVRYGIEGRARLHAVGSEDRQLVAAEFGFVGGVVFGVLTALVNGATGVLMRRWEPDEAVRLIAHRRISYCHLMPTHVHDLLASPLLDTADVSSLWRAAMGGLARERRLEVEQRLCPKPLPGYGMSECLGNATCSVDDLAERVLSTDGRPYAGTELRIVDQHDAPVATGVVGAVTVRGPSRCLGYFDAPQLTRDAFTEDGFYRTGDLGRLDADGYLTFVGRGKDIIRRGGVTIVPAELEGVLRNHTRIKDVAVIGLPDERLGERACACVITRDDRPITLEEITAFLSSHAIAKYLWPERIVQLASFPKTPSLKVKKPALVEQIQKEDRS